MASLLLGTDALVAPALLALIHALDTQYSGVLVSNEFQCIIERYAHAALSECGGGGGGWRTTQPTAVELQRALAAFGWDGRVFNQPQNLSGLACRLKVLLFTGLKRRGSGSYATVFTAHSRLSGRPVVLKRMKLEGQHEEGMPTSALREVSLLRQLAGSPHIVQLEDVLWDPQQGSLYFVLERLSCDLREHLDTKGPAARALPAVKSAMYQALKGVAHAHSNGVIHRDIKPQNLLLDRRTGCVKLADFGLARAVTPPSRPYTHEVVTLLYRAPEILLGEPFYSMPVDVWALGCVMAELVTGQPLFNGDSEIGQLLAILQVLGTPGEAEWPGASSLPDWQPLFPRWRPRDLAEVVPPLDPLGLDLLRRMLRYDPSTRIRCRQALQHPWFDDVREVEEARSRAVMEGVEAARRARRERLEAVTASYSHLVEPEGPSTPCEPSLPGSAHPRVAPANANNN